MKKTIESFKANQKLVTYSLLILLSIIWGGSFFFIKKGLIAFSWQEVAALRLTLAFIMLLPFFYKALKTITKDKYPILLVFILSGNVIPAFLFPLAQTNISSSLSGILNALSPLLTFVIGIFLFKTSFIKRQLLGVLLGFSGTILLILRGADWTSGGNQLYGLFIVVAAFFYGLNSNLIKAYFQEISSQHALSLGFAFVMPFALSYLLLGTDFIHTIQTHEYALQSFISVFSLTFLSTVLSMILYMRLVKMTSALFGATVAYIIPVIAVFIGFLDGELITLWHFIGMAFILFGVYLTRSSK
ncbi:MAG: hypothetical protein RI943_1283 [Bacteroidota bacterium]|jgi:drug/metabolite transporter (DMT)-like permease